jgi:hypothetical protein
VIARRQIAESRRRQGRIAAGRRIVVHRPGACIHPVMEGVIIPARQIRQNLEAHVRRRRQGEIDLHLAGRGIRGCTKVLVRAVIRPLDRLTTRGRRIVHHRKRGKQALAREAFQFYNQAAAAGGRRRRAAAGAG